MTGNRVWSVSQLLVDLRARAERSGLDVIDLGQGTPIDPTPELIRDALSSAADSPGYPPAHGTPELRASYCEWAGRRWGATVPPADVIATVGSKELVATIPWMLGAGRDDTVVIPALAYPTYAAGAVFAGCQVLATDSLTSVGPSRVRLVWLNTPANPTGRVLPLEHLRKVVDWARERDTLVVSDECYIELTDPAIRATSVLAPEVNGGSLDNVLAVHSLSKRSSMAGYRCGFVSGDATVIARLLSRRRDAGLLVPGPVQGAAVAALNDDHHVAAARSRYAARRAGLRAALERASFRVDHSEAGLFVWATNGTPDRACAERFADLGIVVAPGGFYGAAGAEHVRLAITASDAALAEVAARLTG